MELYKKFSFGLSPKEHYNIEELEEFLKQYHRYIYIAYSSPPSSFEKYHSRKSVLNSFKKDPEGELEHFKKQVQLLKNFDIKFELALNTHMLKEYNFVELLNDFISTTGVIPDEIVTMSEGAKDLKNAYPNIPLIYSYNNALKFENQIKNIPKEFYKVVVGNAAIRDLDFIEKISSAGFEVEYLLNNGCLWDCSFCNQGVKFCNNSMPLYLENYSPEYIYSVVSVLPFEFHKYIVPASFIDTYKISSRVSTAKYLENTFKTYIENINTPLKKKNLHSWARLGELVKFHKIIFENFDKVLEYKKGLWEEKRMKESPFKNS